MSSFREGKNVKKIKGVSGWDPSRGHYGSLASQWGRFTKPDCFIDLIPDLICLGRCYKIDLNPGQLFATFYSVATMGKLHTINPNHDPSMPL